MGFEWTSLVSKMKCKWMNSNLKCNKNGNIWNVNKFKKKNEIELNNKLSWNQFKMVIKLKWLFTHNDIVELHMEMSCLK